VFIYFVYKIIKVRGYLVKRPIFILYYLFLLIGLIFLLACDSLGLAKLLQGFSALLPVLTALNLLTTLGNIFIDVFLTLVPNFYFSLLKTKLNKVQSQMSKRYFYINLTVSLLFIIFMPIACYLLDPIAPNIAQILELVYTICFYLVVLWDFRKFDSEYRKVLWTFFFYYFIFAIINIVANIYRILDQIREKSIPELTSSTIVNHITVSTSLVILLLYLKKMTWRPKSGRSTEKTSSANNNELKSLETGSAVPVSISS